MNGYFDNAATSFPKPKEVALEINEYLNNIGGSYGRSSYPSAIKVATVVEEVRDKIAGLIGVSNAENICFTLNATFGINTILNGILKQDSEVLISGMEHNAVMRPLISLKSKFGIKIKYLPSEKDGRIQIEKFNKKLLKNTSLIIINHQSNVNGVIQPVNKIKKIAGDIPVLLDLAQSLGEIKIEIDKWDIDYAAFTGHKAVLGPTGTGGFYIKDSNSINPLVTGGTGSRSESYDYPEFMPDKFDAGTPNIAGIFGLHGALTNIPKSEHTENDFIKFIGRIRNNKNYKVYCAENFMHQGKVFSINSNKMNCSELCRVLSEKYNLYTRAGLHCAPLAHKTLGTFPDGTLRISSSVYHTVEDFDYFINALNKL